MHVLPHHRRILLLTEGRLGIFTSKTAASLLRYRASDIVGILDSHAAGQDPRHAIPWSPPVSICATFDQAADLQPDSVYIGIAPVGGALPVEMRAAIESALVCGVDVVSGLHTLLTDEPAFAAAAQRSGARIFDLRRAPPERTVASRRACTTRCKRILTVGTDCNVGKMIAALEMARAARLRGFDARFVATGQTGIMIAGTGVGIDAIVSDFTAGAAETLVLSASQADLCFVEGQGSLAHPGYSGVTLSLLHGTCPDAMVLVHHAGRTHFKADPGVPLASLAKQRQMYEFMAELVHPARVAAVALNTVDLSEAAARQAAADAERELTLPVADTVRDGPDRVLDAVLAAVGLPARAGDR